MGVTWPELYAGAFTAAGLEPFMPAFVAEDYYMVLLAEGNQARRDWEEADRRRKRAEAQSRV